MNQTLNIKEKKSDSITEIAFSDASKMNKMKKFGKQKA